MHNLLKTFAALLILAPALALAQFAPEPVQYLVAPEVPGPNQSVMIELQGVGTFLGDAVITWRNDGKVVQSGAGLRTYTFTTGALGSATKIRVDTVSATNGSFSKELVFRPSVINLVWEADTSAPPLYAGKPLYSAGSPLKVAAFPTIIVNGARVAEQSLSYQWSRNDTALPAQSGLGRSTLSFDGDQLQQQELITVDVYFGTSLVGRSSIAVPASAPQVLFYERDALRGLLTDMALPQAIALNGKEITLVAQPYHFARASLLGGAVAYSWTLNGNEISGPDSAQGILTLRQTGSGAGQAELDVSVQNNNQDMLVQAANAVLQLIFGGQSSSPLFGL